MGAVDPVPLARARAFTVLDHLMEATPPPADGRIPQAILAYRSGQGVAAVDLLDDVVALDPSCEEALYHRVEAYRSLGDKAGLLAALADLEEAAPDSPRTVLLSARTKLEGGRPREALPGLRRAVELDPTSAMAHYALGRALFAVKDWDGARREFTLAKTILPRAFPDIPLLMEQLEQAASN